MLSGRPYLQRTDVAIAFIFPVSSTTILVLFPFPVLMGGQDIFMVTFLSGRTNSDVTKFFQQGNGEGC